eukprot:9101953-Pyramimonas_sp.AAC.1
MGAFSGGFLVASRGVLTASWPVWKPVAYGGSFGRPLGGLVGTLKRVGSLAFACVLEGAFGEPLGAAVGPLQ